MVPEKIYFSRDYSDIPRQLLEYSNDSNMLKAISDYAKAADVGIEDMKFEINSKEINEEADLPANIPEEVSLHLCSSCMCWRNFGRIRKPISRWAGYRNVYTSRQKQRRNKPYVFDGAGRRV